MSSTSVGGVQGHSPYLTTLQQQGSTTGSPSNQMFNNLQALQKSNPAKCKKTLMDISHQLQLAAQHSTGQQAQMFSDMSAKYQQAAQSGDLTPLKSISTGATGTINALGAGGQPNTPNNPQTQQLFSQIYNEVQQASKV